VTQQVHFILRNMSNKFQTNACLYAYDRLQKMEDTSCWVYRIISVIKDSSQRVVTLNQITL